MMGENVDDEEEEENVSKVSRLLLTPAVHLILWRVMTY